MRHSISTNAIYLFVGQYANRAFLYVFYVIFARLKGDALLGEFTVATAYASLIFVLVSFGLDRVVLREISRQPSVTRKVLTNVFRSQALMWIVTLPLALSLVFFLDYSNQIVHTIWLLILFWVLPSTLYQLVNAAHQGLERMGTSSILGFFSALQLMLLGVAVLLSGGGLLGIAAVMVWERISTTLLGIVLIRRYSLPNSYDIELKDFRIFQLLREAFPFLCLGLFGTLYQRIDVLMMPIFVSDAAIGQYGTAYRILEALLVLPAVIATAAMPVMINTVHNEFSRYKEVAGKSLQYSLVTAGLAIGIAYVFANPIIIFVFGDEFLSAAYLLQILVWGLFFQSINNTLGRSMIAANLERFFIPLALLALISNVVLNLYLLPRIGVVGAAVATLGSYAFSTSMHIFVVWKHKVMPNYRSSLLVIISFIIAGSITWPLLWRVDEILSVILGALVYIICLFCFKVVSIEQVHSFYSQFLPR